jgi:hypothetical protein
VHAAAACSTCGYFLPLAGSLRQVFGACGNEWSGSDGQVVSVDHGCGAHSETDVERIEPEQLPPPILDETGFEAVVLPAREPADTGSAAAAEPDGEQAGAAQPDGEQPDGEQPDGEQPDTAQPAAEGQVPTEPEPFSGPSQEDPATLP